MPGRPLVCGARGAAVLAAGAGLLLAAPGAGPGRASARAGRPAPGGPLTAAGALTVPTAPVPSRPIGRAAAFHAPVVSRAALAGRLVDGLRCAPDRPRVGAHVELFAAGRVVLLPAGIGVAGGRRSGAYVRGGRCAYALRTTEPTGVVEVAAGVHARLGDLFALWGRPLSRTRLGPFRGTVRAWVGGRRVGGDPRAIALGRHAQVVLAVGPAVPVHPSFTFRPGL